MVEKYIINENTLAIIPEDENKSKVIEKYISIVVNMLPTQIINESCLYYGSSLEGRCEAASYYLGTKYKTPVIINETSKIIFFPTSSYKNVDCMWINYNGIHKFYVTNDNKESTTIELINDRKLILNITNRKICNQFLKSSRLDTIYKSKNR